MGYPKAIQFLHKLVQLLILNLQNKIYLGNYPTDQNFTNLFCKGLRTGARASVKTCLLSQADLEHKNLFR